VAKQSLLVVKVVSDTEVIVKEPGLSAPLAEPSQFKLMPKVDQTEVYDSVYDVLQRGSCIGIFPEGGSHDRTELLPLKAGFTIMALGALSKYPDMDLKIVPVGLNYFKAHAFRSMPILFLGGGGGGAGMFRYEVVWSVMERSEEDFRWNFPSERESRP